MYKIRLVCLATLVLTVAGCAGNIVFPPLNTGGDLNIPVHARPIETRDYSGTRGAIIFAVNHPEEKSLRPVIDRIIRIFAEHEAPVDIEINVPRDLKATEAYSFLVPYSDAGVIDVNLDGSDISWLDVDSPNGENAYAGLQAELKRDYSLIHNMFGTSPAACMLPYERFNEYNYKLLQDNGFPIVSSIEKGGFKASRQPVTWTGKVDDKGLYRLPVVADVSYQSLNLLENSASGAMTDENRKYLESITGSIRSFGLAVVTLNSRSFAGTDGKPDDRKIGQLTELIRQSSTYGEIVTFTGWKRYASSYINVKQNTVRILPAYNGGPSVIFRLDDVAKGWHENADRALIEMFKRNGVPLDCGVISNANGTDSYQLSWLKQYYNEGAVGISVHGFDWTYYQLDTTRSGLTYEQIKFKLLKARDLYMNYYGASPVALTAPTDFYDKSGYQAVEDAGFKVFSTQEAVEPYPSAVPVDFEGRKDPGGMYRLPTASDVCIWENEKFGDPFDISNVARISNYCRYYETVATRSTDNDFGYTVCREMSKLNVVVIGIHPSAFVDDSGKVLDIRLNKVDAIVKWVKTFAEVTTFEQWYNYHSPK